MKEYKTFKTSFNALSEQLNIFSKDGWEIVELFRGIGNLDEHIYGVLSKEERRVFDITQLEAKQPPKKKWWKK